MSFLVSVHNKLRIMFSRSSKNAAHAWQAGDGDAYHAFWLYAAPVNMSLGRDSFFLTAPAPLTMTHDESLAVIASLNQHFANDGYYFYLQNGVWFLGLDTDPEITTTHISQVVNHDIAAYLPKGKGALAWAALQNEVQMLLFTHSVNTQRETQGQLLISGLWCYGLGATK